MNKKCKGNKGLTCCKQFDEIGCKHEECLCGDRISKQIEITKSVPICNVPEGEFCIDIEQLRKQVKEGKVEAGAEGLQSRQGAGGATKVPKGTFHQIFNGARRVPNGTFFSFWDILFGTTETSSVTDPIGQFVKDAPYATYSGKQNNEDVWIEEITDALTGVSVTLAYTTSDNGKTCEAYCIDPDLRGHNMGQETIHCYIDGRLCTDLHGVKRNLPEKRARAVLWVSGFANYLKENRFAVDD